MRTNAVESGKNDWLDEGEEAHTDTIMCVEHYGYKESKGTVYCTRAGTCARAQSVSHDAILIRNASDEIR